MKLLLIDPLKFYYKNTNCEKCKAIYIILATIVSHEYIELLCKHWILCKILLKPFKLKYSSVFQL